jgi:undecaprenyl-diphosphatase
MVFSVLISFIVGYVSLQVLQRIFKKQKFHLFAFYCWAIGLLTIFLYFL